MRSAPVLLLALAMLGPAPAVAQDSVAMLHAMEARLDSLRASREHRVEAEAQASIGDTVVAGRLRIATSAAFRTVAQQAADAAWAALLARFGPAVLLRADLPVQRFGTAGGLAPQPSRSGELASGFERSAALAVWRDQASMFGPWLRGGFSGTEVTPEERERIATDLMTIPGRWNPGCRDGSAGDCLTMLGLGLGADTLSEWYAPAAWAELADLVSGDLSARDRSARAACAEGASPDACRALLTPTRVRLPIGIEGRRLMLQLALETGGPAAFERLTEPGSQSLEVRLARAAELPIDTLVSRWIAAVQASTPQGPAQPSRALAIGIGWSACVLALALGGSRWR